MEAFWVRIWTCEVRGRDEGGTRFVYVPVVVIGVSWWEEEGGRLRHSQAGLGCSGREWATGIRGVLFRP